jgi:hypothetical protein
MSNRAGVLRMRPDTAPEEQTFPPIRFVPRAAAIVVHGIDGVLRKEVITRLPSLVRGGSARKRAPVVKKETGGKRRARELIAIEYNGKQGISARDRPGAKKGIMASASGVGRALLIDQQKPRGITAHASFSVPSLF